MIENTPIYDLPKPKTLNLEYLQFYLVMLNLNYHMRKFRNRTIAEKLTAENVDLSTRQLLRQRQMRDIQFSYEKRLYYISADHRILQINEENIDPNLLKLNYS